ncbi:hypothetical protein ACWEPH_12665 [Nocardia beijingensis]|uniref:hypothetical protein n=1 Tax=Nocardia beijingensis TaxID=95162 RepID=UPI0033FEBDB0
MGLFGLEWKDVVSGVASGVGFMVGGPVGAAIIGGATSGIWTMTVEGRSFEDGLEAGLIGAAVSAIPGGVIGGATRGLTGGGLRALGLAVRDAGQLMTQRGLGGVGERLALSKMWMPRLGAGATVAGLSNALASRTYDTVHPVPGPQQPKQQEVPDVLPTRPAGAKYRGTSSEALVYA